MMCWARFRLSSLLISGACAIALLLAGAVTSMANPRGGGGGGGGGGGSGVAIGIGIGLILNAARSANDADRQDRVNRRVAKRKALQDDAEKKRDRAVTKIREAKEAKKARAARPPSKKTLDDQMIDDFNEDAAQQDRADAARKALEEYRQAVAKAQWWQAEAAQAGDVPDIKAQILEQARKKADADKFAREAKGREDYERDKADFARRQKELLESDQKLAAKQEAFRKWQQDNADAKRLDQLRDQHDRFGSKTSAESEFAKEKEAAAAQKQKEQQAQKLVEAATKNSGTAGGDTAAAIANRNAKVEAMEANR